MADAPSELRLATVEEEPAIGELMKASIRELFPKFYDARQTASSERYVGEPDRMLIEDGTYFVSEAGGRPIACGGWSKRDKLYTGSGAAAGDVRALDPATEPARVRAMFVHPDWTRRGLGTRILEACEDAAHREGFTMLELMATLPGVLLYEHFGFERLEDAEVTLPDGVTLRCVKMEKLVSRPLES